MSLWTPSDSILHAVETPAFIINENPLLETLSHARRIKAISGAKVLYALKALTHADLMQKMIVGQLDGFATSSLFESKLARDVLGKAGSVHLTSPGLRRDEIGEISELADYISFNSLSQYHHLKGLMSGNVSAGLRINPMLSYVRDKRYDPCRQESKLGIPLNEPALSHPALLEGLSGIHIHANCESCSFAPLLEMVQQLRKKLHPLMKRMRWVNLGGGYYFDDSTDYEPLFQAVNILRSEYGLEIIIEPGAAFVGESGCIVSSVIDTFTYEGSSFAVLDTTVNHMPEVYEYQYRPTLSQETVGGKYRVLLVGGSCLAGDVFGEYFFEQPLTIGSRLVFLDCGAYTHVKAHMFNGINLPTQYFLTNEGKLELKKKYSYQDFLSRCGR